MFLEYFISKTIPGIRHLKFLAIASTDSYNQSLLKLCIGLKKRNYEVLILLSEKDLAHNYMLINKEIEFVYSDNFKNYEQYDIIFYGNIINKTVLSSVLKTKSLKIGLFFHIVINNYVIGGANLYADYTLCFGEKFRDNQIKNGIVHNIIPIGLPFDKNNTTNIKTQGKTILFLEQHFYPAGHKGKMQLASLLVKLAEEKPSYTIIVKPRSLETEYYSKHRAVHIYKYMEKVPKNLILLKKHLDLESLVDEASIVLTNFSTAIMPAIIKKKPLAFIYGFSSIETQFYNRKMVKNYFNIYKNTPNLIHYKNLISKVDKIVPFPKKEKDYLFFSRKENFTNSFIKFALFASKYKKSKIKFATIKQFKNVIKKQRVKNISDLENNILLEEFYRLNILSGFKLNKQYKKLIKELIKLKKNTPDLELYPSISKEFYKKFEQSSIKYLLNNYKKFPVGFKGYYIKYLYDNLAYNELKKLPKHWHIADYYYTKYLLSRDNKQKAIKSLKKYIKLATSANYQLTHLHQVNYIESAKTILKKDYNETYS